MIDVNGTRYDDATPRAVIDVLERTRHAHERVCIDYPRVHCGPGEAADGLLHITRACGRMTRYKDSKRPALVRPVIRILGFTRDHLRVTDTRLAAGRTHGIADASIVRIMQDHRTLYGQPLRETQHARRAAMTQALVFD